MSLGAVHAPDSYVCPKFSAFEEGNWIQLMISMLTTRIEADALLRIESTRRRYSIGWRVRYITVAIRLLIYRIWLSEYRNLEDGSNVTSSRNSRDLKRPMGKQR